MGFYGTGNASRQQDRTNYPYQETTAGVSGRIQPTRFFAVDGTFDYLRIRATSGLNSSLASRFPIQTLPALGQNPSYVRSAVSAAIDWRTSPGYTTSGGLYRAAFSDYRQTNSGPHSFRRLDAEVNQFIPLLRANWVLAFRGVVSTTDTEAGETVPYFLLPDLGGASELRGYPSWRFRDCHRLLLTGEYRWTRPSAASSCRGL